MEILTFVFQFAHSKFNLLTSPLESGPHLISLYQEKISTYPVHRSSYLVNFLATSNRPGKTPSDKLAR